MYLNTGDLGMKLLYEFSWFRIGIQQGAVRNTGVMLYITY
jgi:hypothetical protein